MGDGTCMPAPFSEAAVSFDEVVLPHLHDAHRLARRLMRNEEDAEDAVQEASLRAFRYFRTFDGGNGRAWFLRIVRNACRTSQLRERQMPTELFEEGRHSARRLASDPESLALQTGDLMLIERAVRSLPDQFRELLVLREQQGLSYRELADAMGIPVGTVMSRLSRSREAFRNALRSQLVHTGISQRAETQIRERETEAFRRNNGGASPARSRSRRRKRFAHSLTMAIGE